MRDMALPHVGEDFPTHALLRSLAVREEPRGGGQDGDPEATEDLGISADFAYTRSPGFDTRLMPRMERSRSGPNLRLSVSVWPTRASATSQPAMKPSDLRMSAMCDLSLECGMETVSWCAEFAFRSRVSMSATGSVIVISGGASRLVSFIRTRMTTCGGGGAGRRCPAPIVR